MNTLGQSLAGRVVVLTEDGRATDLGAALARRGATVRTAPAARLARATDDDALLAATADLVRHPPDAVVVLSGPGVRTWLDVARDAGAEEELLDVLAATRVLARGATARGAVCSAGLTPDWVAECESAGELLDVLLSEGVAGLRVAVQADPGDGDRLDVELAAAGADVVGVAVHRWAPPADPGLLAASVRAAAGGDVDAVVLLSRPAADAWLAAADAGGLTPDLVRRLRDGTLVAAALGAAPAVPVRGLGVTPVVPARARPGALLQALVEHYERGTTVGAATVCGALEVRPKAALLAGHVLALPVGGLEVLRLLVGTDGVVTRAEVLEALPGFPTDAHAAEVAVARLREAAGCPDLVETVVRRGYRLGRAGTGAVALPRASPATGRLSAGRPAPSRR